MTTDVSALGRGLVERLGVDRIRLAAPLAPLTTFKVGGPADVLVRVDSVEDLSRVVTLAADASVPVHVIGGGSNLLVSDAGVRGVVLRLELTRIEQAGEHRVRAGAGVTINGLVRWTVGRGLAALEAWAGTPGTVGGAIRGNAHYGGRNIGDLVHEVSLVGPAGACLAVPREAMGFAYDTSRIPETREVVASAEFRVLPGDADALRAVARQSLAHRKRTQPLASQSAGCVFQNPDRVRDRVPDDVPASAGALIDRAGLKGHRIGGAMISPLHANFIVNLGGATAADIVALMALARKAVHDRFGVRLRDEIVRLGE
ncbi:MAG TPA: UDP-N-acetylmuramate dehydrogenase [Vicinamibacterales bacterium]